MAARVALDNLNLVLLGENFPVSNIKLDDFRYNHRQLRESFRLPVVLQAEAEGRPVSLQIVPDRFQVSVGGVREPEDEVVHLANMAEQFFDYAGPKSVVAVGHNAQFIVEGTEGRKLEALACLVDVGKVNTVLGVETAGADLHLYFQIADGTRGRVAILSDANPAIVLDFNLNYATTGQAGELSARDAVRMAPSAVAEIMKIADRLERALRGEP